MAKRLPVNYQSQLCYDIVIRQDFSELSGEISKFSVENRKIAVVTDSHVEKLYASYVLSELASCCKQTFLYSFPAGEEHKTLDTVKDLYTFLIENGFDRRDMLLALGGGVVGDLTGYAAATYLRGIDFIQVPTTLLAQVDSSIGGKTGVDFDRYKNMVGAFHMPRLVYMNTATLETLDDLQYASGMAEIIKHGLIRDAAYYEWLLEHIYEINDRDAITLEEMIYQSCRIKKAVVEKDPTERGERALLNFGHTLGHAIEKYKNFSLTHGECVALGCVAAAFISWKKQMLTSEEYYEIRDMFVPFGLPISLDHICPEEIVSLTRADKKMDAGNIKFILLKQAGKAVMDTTVTEQEMLDAIRELYYEEEEAYE